MSRVETHGDRQHFNKLKETAAILAALATAVTLSGCTTHANKPPEPTPTVEVESPRQGHIELTPDQAKRVDQIMRDKALNEFLEVKEDSGSDDKYNGYGQLMARHTTENGEHFSYIRFKNTPDGITISTENYNERTGGSSWNQFSNSSPEAAKATSDGTLTTDEAKRIMTDPETTFDWGNLTYTDAGGAKEVVQVIMLPDGATVEVGPKDQSSYRGESNQLDGLAPPSDPDEYFIFALNHEEF